MILFTVKVDGMWLDDYIQYDQVDNKYLYRFGRWDNIYQVIRMLEKKHKSDNVTFEPCW